MENGNDCGGSSLAEMLFFPLFILTIIGGLSVGIFWALSVDEFLPKFDGFNARLGLFLVSAFMFNFGVFYFVSMTVEGYATYRERRYLQIAGFIERRTVCDGNKMLYLFVFMASSAFVVPLEWLVFTTGLQELVAIGIALRYKAECPES